MEWEDYSFIIRGKTRREIFLSLQKPKTPSQISRELKISTTHVSRALKEFSDKNLVKCLTPKEKSGRVYKLTGSGEKILDTLKNSGN